MQNVSAVIEYLLQEGKTELVCNMIKDNNIYAIVVSGDNKPDFEKVEFLWFLTRLISEGISNTFYQF